MCYSKWNVAMKNVTCFLLCTPWRPISAQMRLHVISGNGKTTLANSAKGDIEETVRLTTNFFLFLSHKIEKFPLTNWNISSAMIRVSYCFGLCQIRKIWMCRIVLSMALLFTQVWQILIILNTISNVWI